MESVQAQPFYGRLAPLGQRAVAWVERLATRERIRAYVLTMAAVTVGAGAWNYAGGEGRLDASGHVKGADFLAFYTGARLYRQGRLAAAYDAGEDFHYPVQRAFQQTVVGPQPLTGVHPFVNPPYAVLLYLPFTAFGYPAGLALWWLAGGAALACATWLLRRELAGLQRWSTGRLLAGCLLFFPTIGWIGYGQITPLSLLLYTASFVLLRRGRDGWAGACLGMLAYKPQLALVPALLLLFQARWRALLGGATCGALWLAAGFALDAQAMVAYPRLAGRLADMIRYSEYPTWGVHSLMGFSALLLDGFSTRAADLLTLALSGVTLAMLWRHWRAGGWQPGTPGWDLRMAGTFCLALIVSPHLFLYDLMLLLLPFAIVLSLRSTTAPRPPLGGGPLLAASSVVWLLSFVGSPLTRQQLLASEAMGLGPVALQISTLAVLAWGWVALRLAADPQAPPVATGRLPRGEIHPSRLRPRPVTLLGREGGPADSTGVGGSASGAGG